MPTDTKEPICVRCGLEVRVNREIYEILERMHYVCFHYGFEHGGFDPDEECDAPGCPSSLFNSPPAHNAVVPPKDRRDYDGPALAEPSAPAAALRGLLAPDPEFQALDTAELLSTVPCAAESVLRRGRAAIELGRRAADDPALLTKVAALIRGVISDHDSGNLRPPSQGRPNARGRDPLGRPRNPRRRRPRIMSLPAPREAEDAMTAHLNDAV
jgi:hypothetical protein